ncbi:MAG: hypothetical protein ACREK8_01405 [Gemmatimonadales bacterium]
MPTSSSETQSPAERREAESGLRDLIARHAPAHQRLIGTMRRWLLERVPTAWELAYEYTDWIVLSYSPNANGYDGVLAIRANADGVALYLSRGKELPDPLKLLKGSAKLVRFIPVERAATLKRPEVVALVALAIAKNPLPFPRAGRGPLVIRSSKGEGKGAAKAKPSR